MKLLLDTHIFLWYISGDFRLPDSFLEAICSPKNDVFLSVVSLWEIIIKYQIGKLPLPEPPGSYIPKQRDEHKIESLPLKEGSVARLATLPMIHRDPFDRILICQALEKDMTLVTVDSNILAYDVKILDQA